MTSGSDQRLVAFLRGINLGNRRITNDQLRQVVEDAGLEGVAVYQASGNVVFDAPGRPAKQVEEGLELHFRESLGYPVDTFVRGLEELAAIATSEDVAGSEGEGFKAHVLFLRTAPPPDLAEHLATLQSKDDRFRIGAREVYWLRRGGLSTASIDPLGPGGITRGATGTMRTLGTIRRIVSRFG